MKSLFLLYFCIISYTLSAQTDISGSVKNLVSFGFKAGINVSNMNFNKGEPAPTTPIQASWKPDFALGLFMEVPVCNNLYIQPEYLYSQMAGEDKNSEEAYNMSYLSLPVLLKYKIGHKLAILAGPQFDLLIKAEQKNSAENSNITHDTEERSISAIAGLEFNLIKPLNLGVRYLHGFNHIGIGQRSAVKEFKYEAVQLSAAVKF